ncbi:MAG: type II CAAX endopeptidase family protein [Propioniciclava sp.]|uniref:CPBP family intramembrane glutamic endopeptidase n=1 Tax=Propioniciclava sp. TaxID=2038686 RepID=UPI0039E64C80
MTLALDHTTAPAPSAAPEELGYFRLSRLTPGWWQPLATVAMFVLTYLVFLIGLVVIWSLIPGFAETIDPEHFDMSNPVEAALTGLMLALLIPAARLTVRWRGRRGTVDSVAGRFRWGLFARSVVLMVLPILVPLVALWMMDPVAPVVTKTTWAMLAVALLIIPLQAAGEEYLFRGIIMQTIGHWLRAPIWGVIVSLPLFVLGHNYDVWGLISVGVFAAVATWLTWRTGGLEAAVALHIINNVAVFTLGAFGMTDLNATTGTWVDTLVSAFIPVSFALLFAWWWRRNGGDSRYARTTPALTR